MIVQLACILDAIKVPAARAAIIWIVGEYSSLGQIIPRIVPTVLKYLARCFTSEELDTKHQILNTTAKVFSWLMSISIFFFLLLTVLMLLLYVNHSENIVRLIGWQIFRQSRGLIGVFLWPLLFCNFSKFFFLGIGIRLVYQSPFLFFLAFLLV